MVVKELIQPKIGEIEIKKRFAIFPKQIKSDNKIIYIWLESYYKIWRYDLGWNMPPNGVRSYIEMWCYLGEVRECELDEFINNLPKCNYYNNIKSISPRIINKK